MPTEVTEINRKCNNFLYRSEHECVSSYVTLPFYGKELYVFFRDLAQCLITNFIQELSYHTHIYIQDLQSAKNVVYFSVPRMIALFPVLC
jgi:hypothetical protein